MSTCSETLPDRVLNYLCTKFNRQYTGRLLYTVTPITDSSNSLYNLQWSLNHDMYPYVMQGEFATEDAFYNYVVSDILITKFYNTKRFIARRLSVPEFIVKDFKDPLLTFDEQHVNT